jgi:stearoyl-CoA desaturase (Delta-9 desaturase)
MAILIFFLAHWYLSLFSQTFFLHRYAAHQMFLMSRRWEKFFYWFTYVTQGSSFLSPKAYGIMHRLHHAFADTKDDPHSPSFSKNLFDMMWKTKDFYNNVLNDKAVVEKRFLKGVPYYAKVEKLGDSWWSRIAWGAFYVAFYIYFHTANWQYILLPIHFLMGPMHGVIINWFAHKYGYINFKVNDTAKNLLPFDFLMMGESYHNNHHKLGGRANFGVKWYEFDPTFPIILLLNKMKIVKLKLNNDLNYM